MMALYRGQVHGSIGGEFLFLCFIVIIIGGLDSVGGSFVASILGALIADCSVSRPEAGARAEHPGDGRGAAVAPARALPGQRRMDIHSGDPPRCRALQILLILSSLAWR
jgi:hypothetical protein